MFQNPDTNVGLEFGAKFILRHLTLFRESPSQGSSL